MSKPRRSFKRWVPGLVVAIALLGAVFIAMDWGQIRDALGQASWRPIPSALAATAVSYFCISYSFARVSHLLGIRMRSRDLTAVGFVTTVLNHLVSSGGAAGYSIRFLVMGRYGASLSEVIAASILHFYLTSLAMMAMLPVGLVYFLLHTAISRMAAALLIVLTCLILLVSIVAAGMLFWGPMRKKVIRVLVKVARRVLPGEIRPNLERFDETITVAMAAMRTQPMSLIVIMLLIVIDWAFSAAALWLCFGALGVTLLPGQLISGFVIGTVAGVASMIPGGLGVQEGSMAGVFNLQGVSLERALLASILYRAVYFMVPYAVSLGFYWQLLHSGEAGPKAAD